LTANFFCGVIIADIVYFVDIIRTFHLYYTFILEVCSNCDS